MKKTIENIIIGILLVALVLAVLGIVLETMTLTKAAFIVLAIVSIVYTILQVGDYFDALKVNDAGRQKQTFWFMVASAVIALVIVCVTIFALTGKLF